LLVLNLGKVTAGTSSCWLDYFFVKVSLLKSMVLNKVKNINESLLPGALVQAVWFIPAKGNARRPFHNA